MLKKSPETRTTYTSNNVYMAIDIPVRIDLILKTFLDSYKNNNPKKIKVIQIIWRKEIDSLNNKKLKIITSRKLTPFKAK